MNKPTQAVLISVPLTLSLALASQGHSKFAGWIRKSKSAVLIRSGAHGRPTRLEPAQTNFRKLYVGQWIKVVGSANASLIKFGFPVSVTAEQGWMEILPGKPSNKSRDVYEEFTSPGGRARGVIPGDEAVWRAMSLIDLVNPNPNSTVKVRLRLVPVAPDGNPTEGATTADGRLRIEVSDKIAVDISNDSAVPVSVTLLDIDCQAVVSRLIPESVNDRFSLPANSGWTRLPSLFSLGLPGDRISGIERLKIVATTKPIDLRALESKGGSPPTAEIPPIDDPLVYLLRELSGAESSQDPGDWASEGKEFLIWRRP